MAGHSHCLTGSQPTYTKHSGTLRHLAFLDQQVSIWKPISAEGIYTGLDR